MSNMKDIFKTIGISGFTGTVWFGVFVLVSLVFSRYALAPVLFPIGRILDVFIDIYNLDFGIVCLLMLFYPYVPGLFLGLMAGILFFIFWSYVPEHKRKECKWASSLKYRTRSFLSYCLFLGESVFGIVALLSLPFYILNLIFPREEWMSGTPIQVALIKLVVAIGVTVLSALIVWKCEVYIAKEKQSAAPSLPAAQQQYPPSVLFAMLLGGILVTVLGIYMIVGIIPGIVMLCFFLPWMLDHKRKPST